MASSTGRFPIFFFVAWQWKRSITDTSIRWTPWCYRHLELVPTRTLLYSLYLTLYKIDVTIRQALGDIPKVFILQRVDCTYYCNLWQLLITFQNMSQVPSTTVIIHSLVKPGFRDLSRCLLNAAEQFNLVIHTNSIKNKDWCWQRLTFWQPWVVIFRVR